MRTAILAVLVSLAPAAARAADPSGAAPLVPITGDQIQAACAKPTVCSPEFCKLATAPEPTAWAKTKIPTWAELQKECEPKAAAPEAQAGLGTLSTIAATGLNQSAVLWGTTDFLLSRAEVELRQWAVDRFLNEICQTKLGGTVVFPNSCQLLQGAHLAGFLPGMALYQQALRKDFAHLPALAAKDAAEKAKDDKRRDAGYVAMMLAQALEGQLLGDAPVLSLQRAVTQPMAGRQLSCKTEPAASRLFIVAGLMASIPRPASNKALFPDAVDLPKEIVGWNYALMALAVNATDPEVSPFAQAAWPTGCAPADAGEGTAPFNAVRLRDGAETLAKAIREATDPAQVGQVASDVNPTTRAERYAAIAAQVVQAARGLIGIFGEEVPRSNVLAQVLVAVEGVCRDLAAGRYAQASLEVAGMVAYVLAKETLPQAEFLRLSSFAVEIAQAGSADQAAAALDRLAAPAGSYLRKRNAKGVYFDVNAYVGGFAGVEWAQQATGGWHGAKPAFSPGFWVPVGAEIGTGGRAGSFGLFAQAIDLGVLASWRVRNDDLQARPEVGFEQVFSPGGAIVWGIPRAPISIAVVGALSPRLRVLKSDKPGDDKRNAFRVGVTASIDIPIFP